MTHKGHQAARALDLEDLSQPERLILTTRKPVSEGSRSPVSAGARTDLLKKLQTFTHSMPLEDLEMLVEIAWAVRKRSVPTSLDAA